MLFPHEWFLILAAWGVLGIAFAGIGTLFRWACHAPARDAAGWLTCFWLGWALAIFALQLWQLVLPVDGRAAAALGALGTAGMVASGTRPWRVLGRGVRTSWPALLAFALVAAWLANRALGGPQNGDTGLYHIPTMRWLAEWPIVPGLGNLYVAYAYNHSYFLYLAVLDVGPFAHRSHHLANSILLLALFAHVLLGGFRVLRRRPCRPEDLFYALCLPATAALAFNLNFTSPSPDFPVFVLGVVLAGNLVRLLAASPGGPAPTFDLLALALLAAFGITVKLSLAGFAVGTLAVATLSWLHHPRAAAAGRVRTLVGAGLLGALGVVPWMVRGIILSGYPLFPSMLAGVPVPWRIAPETSTWILGTSQIPGPYWLAFTSPRWFFTWLQTLGWSERDIVLPLAVAALVLPVTLGLRLIRRGPRAVSALVLVPPVTQLVFLFAAAPRARYGGAAFWLLAVEGALLVIAGERRAHRAIAVACGGLLACAPFLDGKPAFRRLAGFEPTPRPALTETRLASGLVVQLPGPSQCCWDGPLPCSPNPSQALRLRRPGELGSGFVLDPSVTPHPLVQDPRLPDSQSQKLKE